MPCSPCYKYFYFHELRYESETEEIPPVIFLPGFLESFDTEYFQCLRPQEILDYVNYDIKKGKKKKEVMKLETTCKKEDKEGKREKRKVKNRDTERK